MGNDKMNTSKQNKDFGKNPKMTPGQEEYHFIKEVIKNDPKRSYHRLKQVGIVTLLAIMFGGIAAVTFTIMLPITGAKEMLYPTASINIPPDDHPNEENAPGNKNQESSYENPPVEESEPPIVNTNEITLEGYKGVYKELVQVSKKVDSSMVTVIGIKKDVDWFNNTYENKGQTAGMIVADNGRELLILTEHKVVESADRILVRFHDDSSVEAYYQKHDPDTGLTILRTFKNNIPTETLDKICLADLGNSYEVQQGEPVIAMGSPMGYSHSIAYGIVTSVVNRATKVDTEYRLLTTDILGSTDGSGILINLEGEVVGVIAQDSSGNGNRNIITGYAISELKPLIEILSNGKEIIYAGIRGQNVTLDISKETGIPLGVYVNSVEYKSPAFNSGIKSSDVIVGINGKEITSIKQYKNELSACEGKQVVSLEVMRSGSDGYVQITIDVILEAL